jgi:hypothetical protein
MRVQVVVAVVAALSSPAAAQAPPSKTLERAIKLYEKTDYYSAHIELSKVVAKETSDDLANQQRATFFLGKTLYQMKLYVPASAVFDAIRQETGHPYAVAAIKWQAALARQLPLMQLEALGTVSDAELADPTLEPVRDELHVMRGLYLLRRGDHARAVAELAQVKPGTEYHGRAQLLAGMAHLRGGDDKLALAAFARVPAGHAEAGLARLAAGQALVRGKQYKQAIAEYKQVTRGPLAPRAAWELSWACLHDRGQGAALAPVAALATTPVLDPQEPDPALLPEVIAFDLCASTPARTADALAGFRKAAPALQAELKALLARTPDDNAEFQAAVVNKLMSGEALGLSQRAQALVHAALSAHVVRERLALLTEINLELDLISRSDRAWQTTAAAAEALTELTLHQSLAEADLGKLARDRLVRLTRDIDALARVAGKLAALAAADRRTTGLTVSCR